MNKNEVYVLVAWSSDNGGYCPDVPDRRMGDAWEDVTGKYSNAPAYIIKKILCDDTLVDMEAHDHAVILGRRTFDSMDVETDIYNDLDVDPPAQYLVDIVQLILARFPGINPGILRKGGHDIFRAGLTRRDIIGELVERLAGL